jgi:outer membrane protein assembly factor BamB
VARTQVARLSIPAFLIALAVGALGAARTPNGHDWPGLLGPNRDGRSAETGLDFAWGKDGPPRLWQASAGLGFSAPAVAGGRVFFFDREGDLARLRALDADTGRELWRSTYPTRYEDLYGYSPGPRVPPLVDGDRVYTYGAEGRLRCLDAKTGALLWELDTAERFSVVQNFFGVGASPIVEGALLIVSVGGSPKGSPNIHSGEVRGNGSGLVAFDKLTGAVRWSASDELASYSSPVIANLHGRRFGFAIMRGGLLAFDPASGRIASTFPWRSPKLESVNAATPVVVGDQVLLSESYGPGGVLLRVGPDGGTRAVWQDPAVPRQQSLRLHWMTPIVHEGTIFASSGSGSGDAELRAVSLANGQVLWREPGLGRATLLLADGHLIVLTEFGRLIALRPNPARYEVVADATPARPEAGEPALGTPSWAPPALSQGRLYLRGKDQLACFRLAREPRTKASPDS